MELKMPEGYKHDPGRVMLPGGPDFEQAASEATLITDIRTRNCRREDTNDRWRLGRK